MLEETRHLRARLALWKAPRVRSSKAADEAIHGGAESFGQSPDLIALQRMLEGDRRIGVDRTLGWPTDRFLVLAMSRSDLPHLGPMLAAAAEKLGLVLFDSESGTLVVPRPRGVKAWPGVDSSSLASLRAAIESTPTVGDLEVDRAALDASIRSALSAGPIERSKEPYPARLPFTVPEELRFAVPHVFPLEKRTGAAVRRRRADLESSRPERRRAAAWHVGGWPPSDELDGALEERLRTDPDAYVRAQAALSLAIHGRGGADQILPNAEQLIGNALDSQDPLADEAASIGVLAAAVLARAEADEDLFVRVRSLAEALSQVESQARSARALLAVVSSGSDRDDA